VIDLDALLALQAASYARAGSGLRSSWPPASAMATDELRSFLEAHRYCVLATVTSKGRPLARPVAFTVLGSSFWFATVAGARLGSLERTPWASIVVAEGDAGEHRAVAADGPVTIIDRPDEGVLDAWADRHGSRPDWAAAWFQIQPTRLVSYSARKAG
jgi:nitroimidazol reductase NimA-like FMN-containing flavoprotein (pyridoxamine 5'-phosphate oxidase superfamily)